MLFYHSHINRLMGPSLSATDLNQGGLGGTLRWTLAVATIMAAVLSAGGARGTGDDSGALVLVRRARAVSSARVINAWL